MLHVHILVLRRRTSMFGNRSIELFNCTNDDSAFGQDEDAHYQLQHLMQQYKDVKKKLKKSNAYISQLGSKAQFRWKMLTDPVTLRSLTTSLHHNFCAQVYSEALFIKVGYHILHMVNLVVVLGVIGNILSFSEVKGFFL